MARNYANIVTSIWRDNTWRALDDHDQRAYLMLVTQPNISAVGVLPLTIGRWAAMARNTKPADIRAMLARLERVRLAFVDEETEEVLVRSFVRHDNGYGNRKRIPVIQRAAGEIESPQLRRVLAGELARLGLPPEWANGGPSDPDGPSGGRRDRASDSPSGSPSRDDISDLAGGRNADGQKLAFSQVDSLSGSPSHSPSDAVSPSEGVVVTKGPYIETPTHNPHSSSPVAARSEPGGVDEEREEDSLNEAERVIIDALRREGHPDATPDDARAVHRALTERFRDRVSLPYLRGIADGTGFSAHYAPIRAERERRAADERRAAERRAQAAAKRAAIDACHLCNTAGYTNGHLCDHDPAAAERARRGAALARAHLAAKDVA